MTIIVEDGSIVLNANSYVTISGVDDYATTYGYNEWYDVTVTETIKEQALMRAMRYMENLPWDGKRYTQEQPLVWPRSDMFDRDNRAILTDVVPQRVVESVCEACILSLPNSPLNLESSITKDDYITKEDVAGSIAVSYKVNNYTIKSTSSIINNKLSGLLRNKVTVEIKRG